MKTWIVPFLVAALLSACGGDGPLPDQGNKPPGPEPRPDQPRYSLDEARVDMDRVTGTELALRDMGCTFAKELKNPTTIQVSLSCVEARSPRPQIREALNTYVSTAQPFVTKYREAIIGDNKRLGRDATQEYQAKVNVAASMLAKADKNEPLTSTSESYAP